MFKAAVSPKIMVAEYKKEGFVEALYNKFQIIQGKIPGTEDQIYVREPGFYRIRIYQGINLIR
jgi:hypothetical protein